MAVQRGRKKQKRVVQSGIAHIHSTFNNTIVTISDVAGNVVAWATAGSKGFKGSRKSTPFAAQTAAEDVIARAVDMGMRQIEVNVRGPGSGREAALRAIAASGIKVLCIRDVTPIPHNGCRPPKRRRV
ncbi:MAG TPA: 30S ribosomal protein S11 [Myxococcales bacterium]|jgi:small subunit ribosomal protein S11|nr:30S ribosomal protein S11 [Myxococcales bacterium]MBF94483.1 30S ribosomal protein S11 [Myxococcales bacterium]HBU48503.1 30S ribosomal protein S11 [Myxococcales bacterium]|tara:strand:- start:693 stop:1076 length:384 start_codon:yes stop_codon:yes gene_type:complete